MWQSSKCIPSFESIVVFGDSLSDVGTFAPYTSITHDDRPPYHGGMFTTNDGELTGIWVNFLASKLGLSVTPAFVVSESHTFECPSGSLSCTGYARGGARVMDSSDDGDNHNESALASWEVRSMSVMTQIQTHLDRFNGTFTSSDLVFVWAGMNDVISQMTKWTADIQTIQDRYLFNYLFNSTNMTDTSLLTQASAEQSAAIELAFDTIAQVANTLGNHVIDFIVSRGAQYVIVIGLPDLSTSPYGAELSETYVQYSGRYELLRERGNYTQWMLGALSTIFNRELVSTLYSSRQSGNGVQFVDPSGLFYALSSFGFSNVATPACDKLKISEFVGRNISTMWSLACNIAEPYNYLVSEASASSWFWADDVHPTMGGHQLLSEALWENMRGTFEWVV